MKLLFVAFETKRPAWVEEARAEYLAKISAFNPIHFEAIKSPSFDRESGPLKSKKEAELLLKRVSDRDALVLFDEQGSHFKSSEHFAANLNQILECGKSRVIFCIGGPFGFDESVRVRSRARWSLSHLTYNHWIAQIVALEQLYRGFTILRNIPYHNK